MASGLEETRLDCAHCGWSETTLRETPRIVVAAASAASSDGGSSSFGGSGETVGGDGGDSY